MGSDKQNLINFMNAAGFDWICDVAIINNRECIASKMIDSSELWWRELEVEGSGFTQLFRGSIRESLCK